jgi:HSP20 family protein
MFLPASSSFREVRWRPAADIYRTGSGWLVKFDLAGVRPEDIAVRVDGRCLIIEGTRRDWLLEESPTYQSLEIAYSRFERCLELPILLERAAIETEYHAGMLLVRIRTQGEGP